GGGSYMQQVQRSRQQGQRMNVEINTRQLLTMIAQFKLQNDRLPQSMEELEAPPGAFQDPWGNAITFEYAAPEGGRGQPESVIFRSAGPDGELNAADEVTQTERLPVCGHSARGARRTIPGRAD